MIWQALRILFRGTYPKLEWIMRIENIHASWKTIDFPTAPFPSTDFSFFYFLSKNQQTVQTERSALRVVIYSTNHRGEQLFFPAAVTCQIHCLRWPRCQLRNQMGGAPLSIPETSLESIVFLFKLQVNAFNCNKIIELKFHSINLNLMKIRPSAIVIVHSHLHTTASQNAIQSSTLKILGFPQRKWGVPDLWFPLSTFQYSKGGAREMRKSFCQFSDVSPWAVNIDTGSHKNWGWSVYHNNSNGKQFLVIIILRRIR